MQGLNAVGAAGTKPPVPFLGNVRVSAPTAEIQEVIPDPSKQPSLDQYYAPAQGKKGVELLKVLTGIVKSYEPHTYSYNDARDIMFGKLDDPTDKNIVTDVYTGKQYKGIGGLRTGVNHGLTAEHVWPQSNGATAGAKTDLHHIITCEGTVNSMRSNLPYGEVKDVAWTSPDVDGIAEKSTLGANKDGIKVFEPRASVRGDLARMQLYFFTRYHGDKPKQYTLKNLKVSLPSLLKWAKEDPPDAAERARNDAIFKLQGNRNPFVDHPEYIDLVGFSPEMLRKEKIARGAKGFGPVNDAISAVAA